jgi:hypothetical protein
MSKYWFRRRAYGIGATPASWEGWVATVVYLGLLIGVVYALAGGHKPLAGIRLGTFIGATLLLTAVFVGVTIVKTEGGLRWTWGRNDRDKEK